MKALRKLVRESFRELFNENIQLADKTYFTPKLLSPEEILMLK